MKAVSRYLDRIELCALNTAPMLVMECHGELDIDGLIQSYSILSNRYPVLRARVVSDKNGRLLEVAEELGGAVEVVSGSENVLREMAAVRWDPSHSAVRLIIVHDRAQYFVVLQPDHSVGDARFSFALLGELWRTYTSVMKGQEIGVLSGCLPRSPIKVLNSRKFSPINAWEPAIPMRSHLGSIPSSNRGVKPGRSAIVQSRLWMTAADTDVIRKAARRHGTTVYGIVSGAIVCAVRSFGTCDGVSCMVCFSNVDLRDYCVPAVDATETSNMFTRHAAYIEVDRDSSPLTIGRNIKEQIESDIHERRLLRYDEMTEFVSQPVDSNLDQQLAKIGISNSGVLPRFETPSALDISDFRVVMDSMAVSYPNFTVITYDDRLSIFVLCPSEFFNLKDAEVLRDRVCSNIIQNVE